MPSHILTKQVALLFMQPNTEIADFILLLPSKCLLLVVKVVESGQTNNSTSGKQKQQVAAQHNTTELLPNKDNHLRSNS